MDSALLYEKPSPMDVYHHQIHGATWGTRNGPPYPLGKDQISSAEKKAGAKVSKSAKERDGDSGGSSSKSSGTVQRVTKAKKYKKISDEDLETSIDRLTSEKRYKDLMRDVYGDPDKEYAKSQMKRAQADVAATVAKNIEIKVGTALATKGVNTLYRHVTGDTNNLIGLDDAIDGIDKTLRLNAEKFGLEKEKWQTKIERERARQEEKAKENEDR